MQSVGRGVERGSHQHPTPGRSGPPCPGPVFLPLCRLPRTLVSRPVLAPGLCGPLGEHFAGPRVPDLPRAALSSSWSGAACSVASALGASPSGGPPACRPRHGCSVYLTLFPHLFPGEPQQGPSHCCRSGRSPGTPKRASYPPLCPHEAITPSLVLPSRPCHQRLRVVAMVHCVPRTHQPIVLPRGPHTAPHGDLSPLSLTPMAPPPGRLL